MFDRSVLGSDVPIILGKYCLSDICQSACFEIASMGCFTATRPMIPVHIWIPEAHVDTPNRFRLHGKHAKRTSATFGLFHLKGSKLTVDC